MQLLVAVQTFAIATGASTLIATAVSLPFTPARLWSWRLRKYMETVDALDDDERYANQREVLKRRGDYIASKVAAATHIPTDWQRFRKAIIEVAFLVGFVITAAVTVIFHQWSRAFGDDYITWMAAAFALFAWLNNARLLIGSFLSTRDHRRAFIDAGCPPDYPVPEPLLRQQRRVVQASFRRDSAVRALARSRRMRDTGMLPADWRPRSNLARYHRSMSAWRRERPWYKGGFIARPS
jgi:hypothetical protein